MGCDSYVWTAVNGGSGQTYTVGGTYTNTTTNAAGCPHTTTLTLTINQNTSSSVPVISCGPYTWSQNGQTYTASGTYTSTTTNAGGCTHTYSLVLTVKPIPPIPVVTVTNGCGTSSLLVTNLAAGASLLWSNGSTANPLVTAIANSYTVTQTLNGCTSTSFGSGIAAPNIAPVIDSVKTTPTSCSVNTGTATVYVHGAVSYIYQWSPGGQNTATATGLAAGTYSITVTANGCSVTSSGVVGGASGGIVPPTPTVINGPAIVCVPDLVGIQYCTDSVPGAISYNWTVPTTASIIAGLGTKCITVTFASNYNTGSICVTAVGTCGNSGAKCLIVSKTTKKPAVPGLIFGSAKLCPGTCATYSIAAVAGATSYLWTTSVAGLTITSADNGTSVTVCAAATGFTSGHVQVIAINCKGSSGIKQFLVKADVIPKTPGNISGQATTCNNIMRTYTIGAVTNATSYTWTVPACAIINSGQGTKSIDVTFYNCVGAQVISVVANSACGSSAPKTKTVNVQFCGTRAVDGDLGLELIAFPNPVKNLLNINFTSDAKQSYVVKLVDLTGRIIYNEEHTSAEGENHLEMNVQGIASGVYLLNFRMGNANEQIRILIE